VNSRARPARRDRDGAPVVARFEDGFRGRFTAMGSPCEVLVDTADRAHAVAAVGACHAEAVRIERKFSRYRPDGEVHRINHSGGTPVEVDEETAGLLDYAAMCHELSAGAFDVTSGVLRRLWAFDGGSRVPSPEDVRTLLQHLGWAKVRWERPVLVLPAGMEIDLGGIGKEYAVDRAAALAAPLAEAALLVNFGGDLVATGPRRGNRPWIVGVDDPGRPGDAALYRIDLSVGALATSGDARRYVTWNGRRLGHILDPRTGWPVEGAPRSITVLAGTCLEAGTLSTLAYLRGPGARAFLDEQGVEYRIA
jgi:thiamine biosynthesis lipoprotein